MKKGFARFATKEIQSDSIVDGEGIRSVIWFQGCSHNCLGCHNPETHDFKAGVEVSLKEMKAQYDAGTPLEIMYPSIAPRHENKVFSRFVPLQKAIPKGEKYASFDADAVSMPIPK